MRAIACGLIAMAVGLSCIASAVAASHPQFWASCQRDALGNLTICVTAQVVGGPKCFKGKHFPGHLTCKFFHTLDGVQHKVCCPG